MTNPSHNDRIAVIGGGTGGVLTAYYLRNAGYSNVTVFEQQERLGGKCFSIQPGGQATVDLGAVEVTEAYDEVRALAGAVGAKMQTQPVRAIANMSDGSISYRLSDVLEGQQTTKFALAVARWAYQFWIRLQGRLDAKAETYLPELDLPFEKWLERNGIEDLQPHYYLGESAATTNRLRRAPAAEVLLGKHNAKFSRFVENMIDGDDPVEFGLALARYIYFVGVKHASFIQAAGMDLTDRDLMMPFDAWLSKHGMQSISNLIEVVLVPYGYGTMSNTSAAYGVRFMHIIHFIMLFMLELGDGKWPKRFTLGYQDLIDKLAGHLPDVKLSHQVDRIERGDRVRIWSNGNEHEYDHVVVATRLDGAVLSFLDATPAEARLLRQVQVLDYRVVVARLPKFPDVVLHTYPLTSIGRPWVSYCSSKSESLVVFYVRAEFGTSSDAIHAAIKKDMQSIKISNEIEVLHTQSWNYFPHVSSDVLRDGFYRKFERLQGVNNTYYVNGLLSFELVENVARYSKYLVGRYFAQDNLA